MPTVASRYKTRFDYADELPRGRGATLSCPLELDGQIVQATSGTFELVDGGGVVLHSGNVTPSATHTAIYAVGSGVIASLSYGYAYYVRWTLVIGSETHVFKNVCGIVVDSMSCPTTETDLERLHSDILTQIVGTGESTVEPWIETAWAYCQRWMQRQGRRASAVLSTADFKELVTYWSLELLFRDMSTGVEDSHWAQLAKDYESKRSSLQGQINWEADLDYDNAIDAERQSGPAVVFLGTHGMPDPSWVR